MSNCNRTQPLLSNKISTSLEDDTVLDHSDTYNMEKSGNVEGHSVSGHDIDEGMTTVQHVESNNANPKTTDKVMAEAEDDPHVAAFQEGDDSPKRLSTSTFIAIFVRLRTSMLLSLHFL